MTAAAQQKLTSAEYLASERLVSGVRPGVAGRAGR
jgi:hypothetical protein